MKVFLLLLILACAQVSASPLAIVKGGVSPDKRLAVAVVPQEGKYADETESTVFLIDYVTRKRIGSLEEVDAGGGSWGTTTENVVAKWSADGRYLIVDYRAGRLNYVGQLYRIQKRRAKPIKLKDRRIPQKSKILDVLTYGPNAGETLSWGKGEILTKTVCGFRGKEGFDGDYSKYGFPDFDHELDFLYKQQADGSWLLFDICVPKSQ